MKSFLVLFLLYLTVCDTYSARDNNHGKRDKGRQSHQSHQSHKSHHLAKSKIKMPSGNGYVMTKPYARKSYHCNEKAKLVELKPKVWKWKKEYTVIKKEMENTNKMAGKYTVVKIQKIFNPCLYKKYLYRKHEVMQGTSDKKPNERMLFHGSPKLMEILQTGFDERYANQKGYFGAGLYFADHSSKSNNFARKLPDGTKQMLLCRVTLGNVHKQQASQTYSHAPIGTHSVEGQLHDPEYIIYRGEQAYPEYLITYKDA